MPPILNMVDTPLINVWCVLNGDKYCDDDVYILRKMVEANLSRPHNFRCLSDRKIQGVDCLIPDEQWPGWWSKLLLFRYSEGQNLYFDLDVVITGPLDGLVSKVLSMPANWAQSGHGGCQSSVMSWGSWYGYIPDAFDPDQLCEPENGNCGAYGPTKLWGDQEYLTAMLGEPGDMVLPMDHIYSYKYHCRRSLPADASVVCFHGVPKPSQVNDSWVIAARSSTPTAA